MLGTIIADIITSNFKREQIKDNDFILFNEDDHLTNISILNLGGYDTSKCKLLNRVSYNTYNEWIKHLNGLDQDEILLASIFSSYVYDNLYDALSLNSIFTNKFNLNVDQKDAQIIVNDMIIKARKHLSKKEIRNALIHRQLDDDKLYSLIEDGLKLFEKTDSFIACIKNGLLEGNNRISIILGATLEEAYNNDIDNELINETLKYLPSELGKVRPLYLFIELLNDVLSSNIESQIILDDTKYMIVEENPLSGRNYVETLHSNNLKSIKDYIIYHLVGEILTPEYNDLVEDLFKERDYEHALKVLVFDNYLNKDQANSILSIIRNIESHEDLDLLNEDFKELTKYLDSDYLKFNLIIYDRKEEALEKLKELIGESIYDYKSIFSKSYNVNKKD